jgi:hypothetical protein
MTPRPVLVAVAHGSRNPAARETAALRARGHRRIAVASYLTAPGDFADLAAAAAPGPVSAPLGAQRAMAELVLARYRTALAPDAATVPHPAVPQPAAG